MSGYSDKEYLKAAIKLKAVNYIEKPLNPVEIRDAIVEARDLCLEKKNVPGKMRPSIPWKALPAWLFFSPSLSPMRRKSIDQLIDELSLSISNTTPFTAIVLKTDTEEEFPLSEANAIFLSVREFLKTFHIDCIFCRKACTVYGLLFLFGSSPELPFEKALKNFFCSLYSLLHQILHRSRRHCYRHFQSLSVLYFCSYFPAEQLFFPTGTFLSPFYQAPVSETTAELSASPENEFFTLLTEKK